jgi:hypothetical protein
VNENHHRHFIFWILIGCTPRVSAVDLNSHRKGKICFLEGCARPAAGKLFEASDEQGNSAGPAVTLSLAEIREEFGA